MAAVEMVGLEYAYRPKSANGWLTRRDPHWALRGVDLQIERGEAIGVVGTNGSGKTTLLQCVAGVLRPAPGQLTVQGRVSALVHLFAGFHRELTGRENLFVAGVLNGLSRREVRDVTDEIVAFAGLDDRALDAPFRTYSAGMGLRLGFAVVVNTRPDVLVVDEILAVGDELFHQRCLDRVAEMRADGCAVMLVSHDLDMVADVCDRAVWLEQGRVEAVGPSKEIVERYHREAAPEDGGERHAGLMKSDREWRVHKARRRL